MYLILIGCEYAGTTTLAHAINEWTQESLGTEFKLIHDHALCVFLELFHTSTPARFQGRTTPPPSPNPRNNNNRIHHGLLSAAN